MVLIFFTFMVNFIINLMSRSKITINVRGECIISPYSESIKELFTVNTGSNALMTLSHQAPILLLSEYIYQR